MWFRTGVLYTKCHESSSRTVYLAPSIQKLQNLIFVQTVVFCKKSKGNLLSDTAIGHYVQ